MSGRKSFLRKYQTITDGSMTGTSTIISSVTDISVLDNVGVQLNFDGTAAGTFSVEGSIDHSQDEQGNVITAGNWVPVALSPEPVASGAAGQILINLASLAFPYIRIKYVNTSGSGTLNAYISGKMI